ncbi:MAG: hypothetical protein R3244_08750 [Thermoanaerobaculia bacterium]|nr:hypothetical protein [Thermoanaerobaculia bacterium]
MRLRFRSSTALLLAALAGLVLAGCGDDSPATPDGQPLVFSGDLEQGGNVNHVLDLTREGTIRLSLTELTPVLIELPPGGELGTLRIGVGLGDISSGTCRRTFATNLSEGQVLTVLLNDPARCLLVFDNGSLPEDAVVAYTVVVENVTE